MNKSNTMNVGEDFDIQSDITYGHAQNEMTHLGAARSERSLTKSNRNCTDAEKFPVTEGGYFQLSHAVFRDPKLRELTGDAFRLYLWLSSQGWRFRDSDGILRASVSFITEALGMPHATVSRGLKALKESHLIRLIETDFKHGNRWWITPKATWSPSGGKASKLGTPQIEASLSSVAPCSNRGSTHLNSNTKPPQIEAEIRNTIPFKKFKNTLSEPTKISESLKNYFTELKPAKKRVCEWKAFRELQADYSDSDIADCLVLLQERGIGNGGGKIQPCHSPMAFLAKAIDSILPVVQSNRESSRLREERDRRSAEAEGSRLAEEAREVAEWQAKEKAFSQAFPSEEKQYEALVDLLKGLPLSAKSQVGRNMALGKWWNQLNRFERTDFPE